MPLLEHFEIWVQKPPMAERVNIRIVALFENSSIPITHVFSGVISIYIYLGLIRKGGWFDGSEPFIEVDRWDDSDIYAPKYFLQHAKQFKYLLKTP